MSAKIAGAVCYCGARTREECDAITEWEFKVMTGQLPIDSPRPGHPKAKKGRGQRRNRRNKS